MDRIFGITFSKLNRSELVGRLANERIPAGEGARLVVTTNLDHVVHLTRDAAFRSAYTNSWTATVDGASVYLYSRCRGVKVPGRIPGPDLFADLMHSLKPSDHRPFFVVSNLKTGNLLKEWLVSHGFQPSSVGLVCPDFGFEKNVNASLALARQIREHGATHLIFGVGAPKSEVWVDCHRHELGECYALGIGAGVDFFVGVERRAPHWMQRSGLEWFWRFAREPRRLFKRYFVDSWRVFLAIKNDLRTRGGSASNEPPPAALPQ